MVLEVKNLAANARDTRDLGSVPGSGRSPGKGNGNPLQYSCLENPMVRGLGGYSHGAAKSQIQTEWLNTMVNHKQAVTMTPSCRFKEQSLGTSQVMQL